MSIIADQASSANDMVLNDRIDAVNKLNHAIRLAAEIDEIVSWAEGVTANDQDTLEDAAAAIEDLSACMVVAVDKIQTAIAEHEE